MTQQFPSTPIGADAPVLDERFLLDACVARRFGSTEYRARHALLGSPVTIFVIDPGPDGAPRDLATFRANAQRAQGLRLHAHVARIFEVGQDGARMYLVEEPLEGPSLATWAASDLVLRTDRVRVARQIVSGLRFSHQGGVVHGDLSADLVTMVGVAPPFAMIRGFGVPPPGATALGDVRTVTQLLRGLLGDGLPEVLTGGDPRVALARIEEFLAGRDRRRERFVTVPLSSRPSLTAPPLLPVPVPMPSRSRPEVLPHLPQGPAFQRRRLRWPLGILAAAIGLAALGRTTMCARPAGTLRSAPAPRVGPAPHMVPAPRPSPPTALATPTTLPPAVPTPVTLDPLTWVQPSPANAEAVRGRVGTAIDFSAPVLDRSGTVAQRWVLAGVEVGQGPAWRFVPAVEHAGRELLVQVIATRDGERIEHGWRLMIEAVRLNLRGRTPPTGWVEVPSGGAQRFALDVEPPTGSGPLSFVWMRNGRVVARGAHPSWILRSAAEGDRRVTVTLRDTAGVVYGPYAWAVAVTSPDALPAPGLDSDEAVEDEPQDAPDDAPEDGPNAAPDRANAGPRIVAASPGEGGIVPVRQGAPLRFGVEVVGARPNAVHWWLDGGRLSRGSTCRLTANWPIGTFHHLEAEVRNRARRRALTAFWSLQVVAAP